MDDVRTMTREYRQYPEYSEFYSTERVDQTGRFGDRPQRESTQVRWHGQDGSREPDSGIGYTHDHQARWADDGWVEPDSFAPTTSQPTGRKRRARSRSAVRRIPDGTVQRRDNQWGIPRKRALFVSDGPDSTTSGSDVLEGHYGGPPDDGYPGIANSRRPQEVHSQEELHSPSRQLEEAVVRLQQDIADYRTELGLNRTQTPAISTRPTKRSGFTSTPVPRFSGKSNWEKYRQVFEAIVRSNGWDDVTAALQLLSHLDGYALNVALLVPESQQVLPGFLVKSLSDHYSSPGRLAEYKPQLKRAFRRPGDDPSIFAIELEMLARRAFVDIDPLIQLQMVRDRFIDGQAQCALRRHLDSLGPRYSYDRHSRLLSRVGESYRGCE